MAYTVRERLLLWVVPRLAALVIRGLGSTLRYQEVMAEGAPQGDTLPGPSVAVFWHRSLLICAHRFRHRKVAILISHSFDGELIARTVERLGFVAVRGSSSRGGAAALRQMSEAYRAGRHCALTADGPRGPAMIAKPGATQLAALVGAGWVGAFYALPERAWVLKTWDHFLIPKPFSRVVVSWPTHVAPQPQAVQQALDQAVRLAESALH